MANRVGPQTQVFPVSASPTGMLAVTAGTNVVGIPLGELEEHAGGGRSWPPGRAGTITDRPMRWRPPGRLGAGTSASCLGKGLGAYKACLEARAGSSL